MLAEAEKISLVVLCFGEHPALARRCLESLRVCEERDWSHVADVRVGLNAVGPATLQVVKQLLPQFPVSRRYLYHAAENAGKYPLMRYMFRDTQRPLSPVVMWFDDDAFVHRPAAFFATCLQELQDADMLGLRMVMGFNDNLWEYVRSRSWYRGKPRPADSRFTFIQGSWWCLRRQLIEELDWPWPELHHVGGDTLLGEQLRQLDKRMKTAAHNPVRLNADLTGREHASPRRGIGSHTVQPRHGSDYRPGLIYPPQGADLQVLVEEL